MDSWWWMVGSGQLVADAREVIGETREFVGLT